MLALVFMCFYLGKVFIQLRQCLKAYGLVEASMQSALGLKTSKRLGDIAT